MTKMRHYESSWYMVADVDPVSWLLLHTKLFHESFFHLEADASFKKRSKVEETPLTSSSSISSSGSNSPQDSELKQNDSSIQIVTVKSPNWLKPLSLKASCVAVELLLQQLLLLLTDGKDHHG